MAVDFQKRIRSLAPVRYKRRQQNVGVRLPSGMTRHRTEMQCLQKPEDWLAL
jgi:hypothetical protein